jgi:5-methylcytosine-specific restriction endonuclease McrA
VAFQSEKYRVERLDTLRLVFSTPESKKKRSAAMKLTWDNERRERYSMLASANSREYWRKVYGVERWEDIPKEYDSGFNEKMRTLIRERHNNKCALCGGVEINNGLDVHHIDYDKQNSAPFNLIALCHGCHTRTNHRRKFWQELFTTYMQNVPFEMMSYVRAVM